MNGGTTAQLIKFRKLHRLRTSELQGVISQLVKILIHFKRKGVMHRDLHNDQIMIHFPELETISDLEELNKRCEMCKYRDLSIPGFYQIKIIDFGRSRQSSIDERFVSTKTMYSGQRTNKCPDLWTTEHYTFNVDVYNIGTIAYELAVGDLFDYKSSDIKNDMIDYP